MSHSPIAQFPANQLVDQLLTAVAVKVQLPPSQYRLMGERYDTLSEYIQRPGSPLADKVKKFYAQGSVAIQATIARWIKTDEYDVDAIAELDYGPDVSPKTILDTLFKAIKGEKGSLYYDMTVRRTRCVTVNYADGMHVDITPSILLDESDPRRSLIFHAHEDEPESEHYTVTANPFGFADWFNSRGHTASEKAFAMRFAEDSYAFDSVDADPVPDQDHLYEKNQNVVALQLIKRFRNVRYDQRKEKRPPSILYSLYAGNLVSTTSLAGTLLQLTRNMITDTEHAKQRGEFISKANPRCETDVFTDRWPTSHKDQNIFLADLKELEQKTLKLMGAEMSMSAMKDVAAELFGENVAFDAVTTLAHRTGQAVQTGNRTVSNTGRVTSVSAGAGLITPQAPTFYGETWSKK